MSKICAFHLTNYGVQLLASTYNIYKELCAQISVGRANVGIVGVKKNEHGMTVFPNSSLIFYNPAGIIEFFHVLNQGLSNLYSDFHPNRSISCNVK